MRAAQLTVFLTLLAVGAHAATRLSRTPADCVPDAAVTAASTEGVTYFPAAFQTKGDVRSQDNRITEVRGHNTTDKIYGRSTCVTD